MSCPSQSTQLAKFHNVILTTQLVEFLVSSNSPSSPAHHWAINSPENFLLKNTKTMFICLDSTHVNGLRDKNNLYLRVINLGCQSLYSAEFLLLIPSHNIGITWLTLIVGVGGRANWLWVLGNLIYIGIKLEGRRRLV